MFKYLRLIWGATIIGLIWIYFIFSYSGTKVILKNSPQQTTDHSFFQDGGEDKIASSGHSRQAFHNYQQNQQFIVGDNDHERIQVSNIELWYEGLVKSHYYHGLDIFKDVPMAPLDSIIQEAIKLANTIPETPLTNQQPIVRKDMNEWNKLTRLTNLLDVVQDSTQIFKVLVAYPNRSDPRLFNKFKTSPFYYTLKTCENAMWSEYPFIREEGYRCLHDINQERPSSNWPNDEPKYHLPSLVLAKNAQVTGRGYLQKNDKIFLPSESCWPWNIGEWIFPTRLTKVNKSVFVITNYWLDAVHHILIESTGRLAPYLSELLNRDDILIHVPYTHDGALSVKVLTFLGIQRSRLVTGNIDAPLVIMPEPPLHCGVPSPYQTLSLHKTIVSQMGNIYPQMISSPSFAYEDYILVIKRSKVRRLTNHDQVMKMIAEKFPHETIKIFGDDPSPSLTESYWLFRNAKMVVGPHGAGMGNMIACRPDTIFVEFLTNDNWIQANFALFAQTLGHEYHGFASDNNSKYKGTITVDTQVLERVLDRLVRQYGNRLSK